MADKKYWEGIQKARSIVAENSNEFNETLPAFSELESESFTNNNANRRDFLKFMGFSTSAAVLAASCETPVRKSIPFTVKPDNVMPGIANYFATTYVSGGDAVPVLVRVREGRPVKIEGNEASPLTKGTTSAQVQASVLSLYDNERFRQPKQKTKNEFVGVNSWEAVDAELANMVTAAAGKQIVLITPPVTSPSTNAIINNLKTKYAANFVHVAYNAVSYAGIAQANASSFGTAAIPMYYFNNAEVVVSLGADFMGSWLLGDVFSKQFAQTRKINSKNAKMSKHYQFESMLSMTGANADERYTHRPSEEGRVAVALLAAVNGTSPNLNDKLNKAIAKCAADLKAAAGKAVVVSGSNDVNVQLIVNAINSAIGAYGNTISFSNTIKSKLTNDAEMETFFADLKGGKCGLVMAYDVNPVYSYYKGAELGKELEKVNFVSFADRMDETASVAKWILPTPHYLESWGDAEPVSGFVSLMQPTINPLFKSRPWQTTLLRLAGDATSDYNSYWRNLWTSNPAVGSTAKFDKLLETGIVASTAAAAGSSAFNGAKTGEALAAINSQAVGTGDEVVLYTNVAMGDGRHSNNPWLQELPDPVTKAAWDNYAMISMAKAKTLGIAVDDLYEVMPAKPTIKVGDIELAAMVVPGMDANTIAIALGYGKDDKTAGKVEKGAGKNAYKMVGFNGKSFTYIKAGVTVAKGGKPYSIAQNQSHGYYEDRREVVRELSIDLYKKNPNQILNERENELHHYGGVEKFREEGTLYPNYEKPGIHWGMNIDLNLCNGCGACVVACTSENNVAVVGKTEMMRGHDMHWLRIDRYYSASRNDKDFDNIDVVFMPMLCQHCDNAPCENVCPVAATPHSSEGINQMTYNRCIGTRYCANNCPFKVRRFNWADYMGADSFPDNQRGEISDAAMFMNEELTRMVINPDVTVRSRGVIEKCSFCVQRLQAGKLVAKKENRMLGGNEVRTACQQSCPTGAIVFGNYADKTSDIYNVRHNESPERLYHALEMLHVLPNISYLAKVRNKSNIANLTVKMAEHHAEEGHGGGHGNDHEGSSNNHGKDDGHKTNQGNHGGDHDKKTNHSTGH
jgi:Fe-S-cluster-containing dehydrogenase component/anaerobic selenocysteine-containing dehydrogenase